MVLLPLAHAASEMGPSAIRITAPCLETVVVAGTQSIEIRLTTMAPLPKWEESRLVPIRGVLQQYFGAAATLRIEGDLCAIITWPAAETPTQADAVTSPSPV
jgi:hypothetical protein